MGARLSPVACNSDARLSERTKNTFTRILLACICLCEFTRHRQLLSPSMLITWFRAIAQPTTPNRSCGENMNATTVRMTATTDGWTFQGLLDRGERMQPVERVSASQPANALRDAIRRHELEGLPMIIEGWHERESWPEELLTAKWLRSNRHAWGERNGCLFRCAFCD